MLRAHPGGAIQMRAAPVSSLVRAVDIPFELFTLLNGLRS
jgi:hypothetical protein